MITQLSISILHLFTHTQDTFMVDFNSTQVAGWTPGPFIQRINMAWRVWPTIETMRIHEVHQNLEMCEFSPALRFQSSSCPWHSTNIDSKLGCPICQNGSNIGSCNACDSQSKYFAWLIIIKAQNSQHLWSLCCKCWLWTQTAMFLYLATWGVFTATLDSWKLIECPVVDHVCILETLMKVPHVQAPASPCAGCLHPRLTQNLHNDIYWYNPRTTTRLQALFAVFFPPKWDAQKRWNCKRSSVDTTMAFPSLLSRRAATWLSDTQKSTKQPTVLQPKWLTTVAQVAQI